VVGLTGATAVGASPATQAGPAGALAAPEMRVAASQVAPGAPVLVARKAAMVAAAGGASS